METSQGSSSQQHHAHSLNIRWSLWVSGTTCASHPSFPGSSSGRCLKANEARCALHSCSSLPSLSQAAVSQRCGETAHSSTVSEPASNESDERRTPFLSLCSVLPLSLHHTVLPSLCRPLSPPCPAAQRHHSRRKRFTLASSPCRLSRLTETGLTSIRTSALWLRAWEEEEEEMDSNGKWGLLKKRQRKRSGG